MFTVSIVTYLPVHISLSAASLYRVLDEYWSNHPELQEIPIYYASSLAKKCMSGKDELDEGSLIHMDVCLVTCCLIFTGSCLFHYLLSQ